VLFRSRSSSSKSSSASEAERSTLGDLEALSNLKKQMKQEEKKN